MTPRVKKRLAWTGATLLVLLLIAHFFAPSLIERRMNRVRQEKSPVVSQYARDLHRTLWIADLHADSLLFDRDLLKRNAVGQVDLPRLQEGNVALQAFTVVTKASHNMNIQRNENISDDIRLFAILRFWPPATWNSLAERALYQAGRLQKMAEQSSGQLSLLRTRGDLEGFLRHRAGNPQLVASFLGIEGAHALDGKLEDLERFYDAGFRMMSPSHFFDTEIGGSAHGAVKGGLTPMGHEWVRRMEEKHMLIDLAHASAKTLDDILQMATRPVVVSHTGVRGTCDNQRNLSDTQLQAIARNGGVVGIGYWETAVCGTDPSAIARTIAYAAHVIGAEHVALGSDFDGAVTTPFDTAGVVQLTQTLLDAGLSEREIRLIMGENAKRLLLQSLPPD